MGEAPAFVSDVLKFRESETAVTIRDKTYVIGSVEDGSPLSFTVRIFDKTSGNWVTPVVQGTEPEPCKGYSSVPLNDERILIIKKGSDPNDCLWFLEVETPYIREQKRAMGTEVVAWSRGVIGNSEKPIVISGPSGVGKGTLISMLMKEFPSMFGFSVSHTTRAPRNMEKDGVHYHFTEKSVMEKEIKDGKFLEFASVHGNLYGTSIEAVEVVADDGKRCILDIDVQGARSVKASSVDAVFIFICPPSMDELEKRLRARGTEAEEQIVKRLRNAEAEIEQGKSSGIFEHILYNDNLEDCYNNLKKLLELDGTTVPTPNTPSEGIVLPEEFSVSKNDNKIIIKCGRREHEKASESLIVLDLSLLKGGAPGRTRGLHVHTIDSFSNGLNEINGLS